MAGTKSKRRTSVHKKREMMIRVVAVTGWEAGIYLNAEGVREHRERKAMVVLDVYGHLDEPVRGVSDIRIALFAEPDPIVGTAEVPSVGSVISVKPTLDLTVTLADRELNLLTAMVAANKLKHMHICFQEPRYGRALVASCSFESRNPDGE